MRKLQKLAFESFFIFLFTITFGIFSPLFAQAITQTLTAPVTTTQLTFAGIINTIIQIVVGGSIFAGVVFLVIYGIRFITAGDDVKKINNARKGFTGAVIGITAVLMVYTIIKFVAFLVGADSARLFDVFPSSLVLSTKSY